MENKITIKIQLIHSNTDKTFCPFNYAEFGLNLLNNFNCLVFHDGHSNHKIGHVEL
jgi:hypothetical protein